MDEPSSHLAFGGEDAVVSEVERSVIGDGHAAGQDPACANYFRLATVLGDRDERAGERR